MFHPRNSNNIHFILDYYFAIILSFSPEVIKNEPYGEKTDLWALGCIVYEMCTLVPPFFSSNMLTLAKKVRNQNYRIW